MSEEVVTKITGLLGQRLAKTLYGAKSGLGLGASRRGLKVTEVKRETTDDNWGGEAG